LLHHVTLRLLSLLTEFSGREADGSLEGSSEMVGTGKSAGNGHLGNWDFRLLEQQTGSILHSAGSDEGSQRSVVAALGKGGADGFL